MNDSSHPLHHFFGFNRSGIRLRVPRSNRCRYRQSFVPNVIHMFNANVKRWPFWKSLTCQLYIFLVTLTPANRPFSKCNRIWCMGLCEVPQCELFHSPGRSDSISVDMIRAACVSCCQVRQTLWLDLPGSTWCMQFAFWLLNCYCSYRVNEVICIGALRRDLCIWFGYITKMVYWPTAQSCLCSVLHIISIIKPIFLNVQHNGQVS